jgi:hypothetical protein
MAKKNENDMYEIRVMVAEKDVQKLEAGEILEIGCLSFGLPIKISLQKTAPKAAKKVVCPAA